MKRLALSLLLAGSLAACADNPTAAPPAQDADAPRVVNVYDESDFASLGIAAPSVDAIVKQAGRSRVNAVRNLTESGAASLYYNCPAIPLMAGDGSGDVSNAYYGECPQEPVDCYSDPYARGCGDPCQWDSSLPECQPTPTGAVAQFGYGSSASGPVWVNRGGTLLKEVTLTSWSTANANVAFTTLDASFRNVGAESGYGCNNASQQFDSSHSSGSGSPLTLQSSRVANYLGTIKWEVTGTHGFTPVSGATGGGTFYSSHFVCG
ncbi:MAG TPA: hypothetical protein VF665_25530 [Longimicrobium sp.]|jgi:hypothetical protein|uniref:hypothetical protein n=1 Tax=Longimicrobium sp. TaxID=2029185 RepID=UPI002EDAFCE3